jgi:DNA-binding response OmpR family regulator
LAYRLGTTIFGIVREDWMLEDARGLDLDRKGSSAASIAQPATPRLLVIDDDKLHRMIVCRAAAKAGYAPAGAATYEEAANLVEQAAFDCVTLDLSLGPHAGVEMLQHLWSIGCTTPIFIISGCDDTICRETVKFAKSLKLNVLATIPKPVDLALLHYLLEQLKAGQETAPVAASQSRCQISPE